MATTKVNIKMIVNIICLLSNAGVKHRGNPTALRAIAISPSNEPDITWDVGIGIPEIHGQFARFSSDRSDIRRDVDINLKGPFSVGPAQRVDPTGIFVPYRILVGQANSSVLIYQYLTNKKMDRKKKKRKY